MTAPDYAAPIVAWRAWHVVRTDGRIRLHAVGRRSIWEPAVAHTATCLRRRTWRDRFKPLAPHSAPAFDCTCGIWAVKTPARALAALDVYSRRWKPMHRIVGTVSLWGEVVEHSGGWRAQYAYPARLYVPSQRLHGVDIDAAALADALTAYRVPVTVLTGGTRSELRRALEPWPPMTAASRA